MPMYGIVLSVASSIHESDGFGIALCGYNREYKEPQVETSFAPRRLMEFVPQKANSMNHCHRPNWA